MRNRVAVALFCLRISQALYLGVGLLNFALNGLPGNRESVRSRAVFLLAVSVVCLLGVEIVVVGLRKRRFWGWVAGLCVLAIYLPSPFLPLGAIGMFGLLSRGARAAFGISVNPPDEQKDIVIAQG